MTDKVDGSCKRESIGVSSEGVEEGTELPRSGLVNRFLTLRLRDGGESILGDCIIYQRNKQYKY